MTTSNVELIRPADRRRIPWKNGAGTTEEIATDQPDSGRPALWRFSIATLGDEPTQFSTFAGVDRIFTVIGEYAVQLDWADTSVELPPWHPQPFSGIDAPRCTPLGATTAFNVMVDSRRASASVGMHSLRTSAVRTDPRSITLAYLRSGSAEIRSLQARPGDCVLVTRDEAVITGTARLLVARVRLHG